MLTNLLKYGESREILESSKQFIVFTFIIDTLINYQTCPRNFKGTDKLFIQRH